MGEVDNFKISNQPTLKMWGRTEKSTRKEKLRLGEEDKIKHRIFTRWGWEAGNKRNINDQTLLKKKKVAGRGWLLNTENTNSISSL